MAGRFRISETKNGGFKFDLVSANRQVIATSQTYTTLDGCRVGIESTRKICASAVEDQTKEGFEPLTHPKYELYRDRNGEIILMGEGYQNKDGCLRGIRAVGRIAPEAEAVNKE